MYSLALATICMYSAADVLDWGSEISSAAADADEPCGNGASRLTIADRSRAMASAYEVSAETPGLGRDLVNARGIHALSKEGLLPAYPTVTPDDSGDTETALYDELLFGDSRALASDYSDFRTFVREALGEEEYQFLRDASRFRADFEAPLDAEGYMDYLTEEWDVYGTPSYPVGGMSAFVRGMADVCLTAIGVETSATAVAGLYGARADGGLLDAWLIAEEDDAAAHDVAGLGIRPLVRPLWMTDAARQTALAEAALVAAGV